MRFMVVAALFVSSWLAAGLAAAQSSGVVVELFTSQGCSSCPPADAMLGDLDRRDGIIPLALHVDYWDYIGWKDEFAQPKFTERQKAYARAAGRRMIYTPQFIIAGQAAIAGFKPMEVAESIVDARSSNHAMTLEIGRSDGKLLIRARALRKSAEPVLVQLVRYMPSKTVRITRGENAGKTLEYHNIVTQWDVLRQWNPSRPLDLSVPLKGDSPVVVLLQEAGPGPILAAARLR